MELQYEEGHLVIVADQTADAPGAMRFSHRHSMRRLTHRSGVAKLLIGTMPTLPPQQRRRSVQPQGSLRTDSGSIIPQLARALSDIEPLF
jgi:hypothetical protein